MMFKLVFWLAAATVSVASGSPPVDKGGRQVGITQEQKEAEAEERCGMYMAPSSVPGGGWGMYTGKDIQTGGHLDSAIDVSIAVVDFIEQQIALKMAMKKESYEHDPTNLPPVWLMDGYHWPTWNNEPSFDANEVYSLLPGVGMLANTHPGLVNVNNLGSLNQGVGLDDDDCHQSRRSHAAAAAATGQGAYTHTQQVTFAAAQDLPAGHEIFVDYSDEWFDSQEETTTTTGGTFGDGDVPLSAQFDKADSILQTWSDLRKTVDDAAAVNDKEEESVDDRLSNLWDGLVADSIRSYAEEIAQNSSQESEAEAEAESLAAVERLKRALPKSAKAADEMLQAIPAGVVRGGSPSAYATVDTASVIRSPEWLDEHGICLDNLRPSNTDKSEDGADDSSGDLRALGLAAKGNGARAVRKLSAGSVVAPAPVVHLSRKHLEMRSLDGGSFSKDWLGHQLLLNYCYGHPASSMLFFPYSPVVNLINHAPTEAAAAAAASGPTANVALRWSNRTMPHQLQEEWLEKWTVAEMLEENGEAHLVMEIYATRDIEPGEEVLLDYGTEWQEAWDEHVKQNEELVQQEGSESNGRDDYVSAWHYEQLKEEKHKIYTIDDAEYPPEQWVDVRCYVEPEWIMEKFEPDKETGWYKWPDEQESFIKAQNLSKTVPCRVVQVDAVETDGECEPFSFRVTTTTNNGEGDYDDDDAIKILGLPERAIVFVNQPYTTPQLLRSAFRHEIGMPDEMIPAQWRDLIPVQPSVGEDQEEKNTAQSNDSDDNKQQQCGLYMAESAIPNSGLGMYTAKTIAANDPIFYGDVVIPVEDIYDNLKLGLWFNKDFDNHENSWLLEHYYWMPDNTRTAFEAGDVQSIVPGIGMLANSHTGLVNALLAPPENTNLNLHRSKDPGTGAMTTYHNVHYTASGQIQAGTELFAKYGDNWFKYRTDMGPIPLSKDFKKSDEVVSNFAEEVDYDFSTPEAKERWKQILNTTIELKKTQDAAVEKKRSDLATERLMSALPDDVEKVARVLEEFDGRTARLTVPDQVRSNAWLRKNGLCLDNIEPKRSPIPQAGMGAFATRHMAAGEVVAPLPMAHVLRKHMQLYDSRDLEDPKEEVWYEGQQLILNYCYGHVNSSLLLFPYAPVVNYINHHSDNFNARIQWTQKTSITKILKHDEWFAKTPDELESENEHAGLSMEIIATRDIQEGEEVLLDYGEAWDTAWKNHMEQWQPKSGDKDYVSATTMNEMPEYEVLKTAKESKKDPNFAGERVLTICHVPKIRKKQQNVPSGDVPQYRWRQTPDLFFDQGPADICKIVARQEPSEDDLHAAARKDSVRPIPVKYSAYFRDYFGEGQGIVVSDIPRRAIQFIDRPYRSDITFRPAFRHEIQIPDAIMPEQWMDLQHHEHDLSEGEDY